MIQKYFFSALFKTGFNPAEKDILLNMLNIVYLSFTHADEVVVVDIIGQETLHCNNIFTLFLVIFRNY